MFFGEGIYYGTKQQRATLEDPGNSAPDVVLIFRAGQVKTAKTEQAPVISRGAPSVPATATMDKARSLLLVMAHGFGCCKILLHLLLEADSKRCYFDT